MENMHTTKKTYKGNIKMVDSQGVGYVVTDQNSDEYFFTSSSISDIIFRTPRNGDRVKFSIKYSRKYSCLKAFNIMLVMPECYYCKIYGHYANECPNKKSYRRKCNLCGFIGHYARDCRRVSDKSILSPHVVKASICDSHFLDDEIEKPLESIVCVKKKEDVKKFEESEDCFILDFDPNNPVKFSNLSLQVSKSEIVKGFDEDVSIIAEKGQVACRDYPHPRHLCATHSFKKTSHDVHCEMCYCYVCDIPAPCAEWNEGSMHCHATDKSDTWKKLRDLKRVK